MGKNYSLWVFDPGVYSRSYRRILFSTDIRVSIRKIQYSYNKRAGKNKFTLNTYDHSLRFLSFNYIYLLKF